MEKNKYFFISNENNTNISIKINQRNINLLKANYLIIQNTKQHEIQINKDLKKMFYK